jgi:hypothetical protein
MSFVYWRRTLLWGYVQISCCQFDAVQNGLISCKERTAMADKCMLVLQDRTDLERRVPAPCSETYATSYHDAKQPMNIKVEAVSDIEVEEEHPLPMLFIGIKAEHEVSRFNSGND